MAVVLRKYNDSFGFIDTDDYSLVMDAWDNFSFFSEGYRFNPKFKNSNWDGKIRLINLATRQFPLGLTKKLYDYLSSYTEDCTMESNLVSAFCEKDIKEEDIKTYFSKFKFYRKGTGEIFPRDDQLYAVSRAIMMKRCTNICPTSFGKSLSIFMEYLWYRQFGMKTIIVVPSVDLCYQFENDITEYCTDLNGKLAPWFPKIQRIHGSQSKKVEKDTGIVISTWQSLASIKKEIPDIMSKFDVFILDEAHKTSGKVIQDICNSATSTSIRTGWTGSLDPKGVNSLIVEGCFGPIEEITDLKTLMDDGIIAKFKIAVTFLKYDEEVSKSVIGLDYQSEIKYIERHKKRTQKICQIAASMKKNGCILFTHIKHGKDFYDCLRATHPERNIYFICGNNYIRNDKKYKNIEELKPFIESEEGSIIVAIYSVFGTGVSIKSIEYLIYACPTKSFVRTLQSIGRSLRISESKTKAILIDIVDDFTVPKKKKLNYAMKHFNDRYAIYTDRQLEYQMVRMKI